ncbi:hypothetical protein V6N13_119214 [Hibiscus sabdariffa]|uniref:Uncharacterized protein n=1 Tax=Hibiscus sabdariffa TaxID=183260 RepID=A0ABR2E2B2_9ROSI
MEGNDVGAAAIVIKLKNASIKWRGINDSPVWQDDIFQILTGEDNRSCFFPPHYFISPKPVKKKKREFKRRWKILDLFFPRPPLLHLLS